MYYSGLVVEETVVQTWNGNVRITEQVDDAVSGLGTDRLVQPQDPCSLHNCPPSHLCLGPCLYYCQPNQQLLKNRSIAALCWIPSRSFPTQSKIPSVHGICRALFDGCSPCHLAPLQQLSSHSTLTLPQSPGHHELWSIGPCHHCWTCLFPGCCIIRSAFFYPSFPWVLAQMPSQSRPIRVSFLPLCSS